MDEIDRDVRYEEALDGLPVSEDTKWLMKCIRGTNIGIQQVNDWLRAIFVVVLVILVVQLTVHWDTVSSIW